MGWCYGFEPPGLELVPPYEIRDAVEDGKRRLADLAEDGRGLVVESGA